MEENAPVAASASALNLATKEGYSSNDLQVVLILLLTSLLMTGNHSNNLPWRCDTHMPEKLWIQERESDHLL